MLLSAWSLLLPLTLLPGGENTTRLEREVRVARQELEAAQSGAFYLVIDARQGKVTLKMKGVDLRGFSIVSIELGRFALGEKIIGAWAESLLDFESETPRVRRELEPQETDEPEIPTSLDEPEPTPPMFRIVCGDGLSIHFVREGGGGLWAAITDRVVRLDEPARANRLRIRLSADDYDALYRVMPERGALIALIPGT